MLQGLVQNPKCPFYFWIYKCLIKFSLSTTLFNAWKRLQSNKENYLSWTGEIEHVDGPFIMIKEIVLEFLTSHPIGPTLHIVL